MKAVSYFHLKLLCVNYSISNTWFTFFNWLSMFYVKIMYVSAQNRVPFFKSLFCKKYGFKKKHNSAL